MADDATLVHVQTAEPLNCNRLSILQHLECLGYLVRAWFLFLDSPTPHPSSPTTTATNNLGLRPYLDWRTCNYQPPMYVFTQYILSQTLVSLILNWCSVVMHLQPNKIIGISFPIFYKNKWFERLQLTFFTFKTHLRIKLKNPIFITFSNA